MSLDASVLRSLRGFPFELERRLGALDAQLMRRRPPSGHFALVEHLCHLRDYDLLGCQARLRRIQTEDGPFLGDFEGDRLAIERDYLNQNAGEALTDFGCARAESVALLERLTDEQLARTARLGSMGDITARRLASIVADHDASHLAEIDQLLDWIRAEADRLAIESVIASFRNAYERGDIAALADTYSDSLLKLRQGGAPESKGEALQRIAAVLGTHVGRIDVRSDEILVSGDLAVARGSFVVSLTPKSGGQATRVQRRYLEVWERGIKGWVVCRTMDNTGEEILQ